jgi:hypothetical protein
VLNVRTGEGDGEEQVRGKWCSYVKEYGNASEEEKMARM